MIFSFIILQRGNLSESKLSFPDAERRENCQSYFSGSKNTWEWPSSLKKERRKGKSKTKVIETTISATVLKTH